MVRKRLKNETSLICHPQMRKAKIPRWQLQLGQQQDKEFANKLNYLKAEPSHWQDQRNRYLREFYNYVESNRDKFPCVQGDSLFGQAVRVREEQQQLTNCRIQGHIICEISCRIQGHIICEISCALIKSRLPT